MLCRRRWEPAGFLSVCLLGTEKRSFFNKWSLWGKREAWMCLLILWISFVLKGPLISVACFFFSLHHQASRGYGSPGHLPSSRSDVSKTPVFTPADFPVLSLHFPGFPSLRLVFSISTFQEGTLLLEVVFICSATRSRCNCQTLFSGKVSATFTCSFPSLCTSWSFLSASSPSYAIGGAGFMGISFMIWLYLVGKISPRYSLFCSFWGGSSDVLFHKNFKIVASISPKIYVGIWIGILYVT